MSDQKNCETQPTQEEHNGAEAEAYYWFCLQEFHAILKIFGQTKVMADLKKIREQVDGVVEKPLIIIPGGGSF